MTEKKEEKGEEPAVGRQRAVILNFWWSLNYGAILTAYACSGNWRNWALTTGW